MRFNTAKWVVFNCYLLLFQSIINIDKTMKNIGNASKTMEL